MGSGLGGKDRGGRRGGEGEIKGEKERGLGVSVRGKGGKRGEGGILRIQITIAKALALRDCGKRGEGGQASPRNPRKLRSIKARDWNRQKC